MLKESVRRLFDRLETIGDVHEELYDTDVREQLAEILYFAFVWAHQLPVAPLSYGMFSEEGDKMVADAVVEFLSESLPAAAAEGVDVGQPRHAAIQDASILTKRQQHYDNFIGHCDEPFDPKALSAYRFRAAEERR